MFLDDKGRLWGKISIVDLLIVAAFLSLLGVARFGGAVVRHRRLAIYQVKPSIVVPDDVKMISIQGTGFSNGCKIQFGHLAEQPAHIINEAVLEVDTPEGLDPGYFGVRIRNPDGRFAELPNGIQIRWNPRIERVKPARAFLGEQVELYGRYFDVHARLYLGDIPLTPMVRESSTHLPMKIESDRPIPPGVYDLTVSNPGGGTQIVRRAIEILPRPHITRIYPDVLTYSERVTFTIEGKNLPKDARFSLSVTGSPLGDPVWISPERAQALLEVTPGLSDWYGLLLQIPNGSKILAKPHAIRIVPQVPMTFLINLNVKEASPEALEVFRQLPEARLAEQMRKIGQPTNSLGKRGEKLATFDPENLWIVVRGQCQMSQHGKNWVFLYRNKPLTVGTTVALNFSEHEMSGLLLQPPIPICTDEEWRKPGTDAPS